LKTAIVTTAAVILGGVLSVAVPVATPPAHAAYSFEWNEGVEVTTGFPDSGVHCGVAYTGTSGAGVCFQPSGDKIWVYDRGSDGASAVARWYTDYGRWGTCRNAHGYGTWAVCNKDFAEHHTIYFRAAQYDGSAEPPAYVGGESALDSSGT
jgi:hypothetical protein